MMEKAGLMKVNQMPYNSLGSDYTIGAVSCTDVNLEASIKEFY